MNSSVRFLRLAGLAGLCSLAALSGCSKEAPASAVPVPVTVGVVTVTPQNQAITTELPGRTSARVMAEIRPQVGGIVQKRLFEEGAEVKAGQVLYLIDPASFQADLASAQAGLGKAEAQLQSSRTTARRSEELAKINAVSQQANDDTQAALQQAQAEVAVARAALDNARINLARTRITAPISGRVDVSAVTTGALVTANQAMPLTTVQQLDPLVVDVTQSSAELLRLKRELAAGTLTRSGENEAAIRLRLEDGSTYGHEGRLKFSGVTVNPGTGAVTLRALVPNPDGMLMPGMYVRALLTEGVAQQALLVPQQGVTRRADGSASALVVGEDGKVARRPLTVDRAIADRWQVTSGLKAGDQVIVDGLQRVKVGDPVKAVPLAESPNQAAQPGTGTGTGATPAATASSGAASR
jgi:membrane fusion protein (multidrug efflux system)